MILHSAKLLEAEKEGEKEIKEEYGRGGVSEIVLENSYEFF